MTAAFDTLFAGRPALLAPMEDVTDPVFRALCRRRGARLCYTEFVSVDNLLDGCASARARLVLRPDDAPTAIQLYGADRRLLLEAAALAEAAGPAFLDLNCGCWVPRVVGRGAGAGWLREPDAMVAMAREVVARCGLPVTVKTRIGYGDEASPPIVELARRLEGVGVRALTVHCRTAKMGHEGAADWRWAARAQAAVRIPVIVNGDVSSAALARRALEETGCAGVMIGRRAIEHPWIFREVRALLDTGVGVPRPTSAERLALCREHLRESVAYAGERLGMRAARRRVGGYLRGLSGWEQAQGGQRACDTLAQADELLGDFELALPARQGLRGARPRGGDDALD